MKLEAEVRTFKKKLEHERDRLTRDLGRINHVIDAFDMTDRRGKAGRKGRKLSKAHRLAIKRGIAAKKAGRKQQ